MRYEVRNTIIEAELVLLSGQKLCAVDVDGKAHLVPGEVFDLFFRRLGNGDERKPAPVRSAQVRKPFSATTQPVKTRAAAGATKDEVLGAEVPAEAKKRSPQARSVELRDKLIRLLTEHGPLTTTELAGHLYPDNSDKQARFKTTCGTLARFREAGLIEKNEDTLQWHLKEAASAK